jgi:two-component system LytT family response regulator
MGPLRVVVADDEEIARKRLSRLVEAMPDVKLVAICRDGVEVLRRCSAGGVDVLLLDIQMPGLTGMEAMALLPEDGPYVVFCTAHAEHAIKAWDIGAVDYLLKPVVAERLEKALTRARSREAVSRFQHERRLARESRDGSTGALDRLAIPAQQGVILLDPQDISHAVLEGELVTVYAAQGAFLTDFSLQTLLDKLPSGRFERVHRRAILNLAHVVRLEPNETGGYVARTSRGLAVEVSRQAARGLRKRLGLRKPGDDSDDAR